jgi:phosphate transport system substrate-binding protein
VQTAKKITALTLLASIAMSALLADAALAQGNRDYVYVVGSSTVFPFATIVAERFGRNTPYKTPKVESTGSGGGFKLFCDGVGISTPDISKSSRTIKPSELETCIENGVSNIVEVKIGYDGIVFANALSAPTVRLTRTDIYFALAKEIPTGEPGKLISNPHRTWADVNPSLPDVRIEVLGPPPTSGTRDEFVELAMQIGCDGVDWIRALKDTEPAEYRRVCHTIREDGAFIEVGENDNLIVQKLEANPRAFGIFGFSYLDQNTDKVKAASIDGIAPTFEAIADGRYPISRPLFFYVKGAHVELVPGLKRFLKELSSDRAWGDDGYLADRGLVPMPPEERQLFATLVRELAPMNVASN